MNLKVGEIINDYIVSQDDVDFIKCKTRGDLINKLGLIGLIDNYKTDRGSSILLEICNVNAKDLVIPDIFVGTQGVVLKDKAVERVALNKHMRFLGNSAFYCTWLNQIELNEGLIRIGNSALRGNNFKELVLPSTVRALKPFSLQQAFAEQATLRIKSENITMTELTLAIASLVDCKKLTLVMPLSVKATALKGFKSSKLGMSGVVDLYFE